MKNISVTKIIILAFISLIFIISQSFVQQKDEKKEKEEKAENLKVLPKNLTGDEIHSIMRTYSKSLGVKCKHCHKAPVGDPPQWDFASDENPKKDIARKMIKMVAGINKKYLGKITTYHLQPVSCVTCHMGNVKPTASVDSLPKKQ